MVVILSNNVMMVMMMIIMMGMLKVVRMVLQWNIFKWDSHDYSVTIMIKLKMLDDEVKKRY